MQGCNSAMATNFANVTQILLETWGEDDLPFASRPSAHREQQWGCSALFWGVQGSRAALVHRKSCSTSSVCSARGYSAL